MSRTICVKNEPHGTVDCTAIRRLLPISRPILERALKLRATHRVRTPDAIHAATALIAGCTLFATNDPVFRRVSGLQAVILDDYV